MKKLFTLIMIMVMSVSVLAGCGNQGSKEPETETAENDTNEEQSSQDILVTDETEGTKDAASGEVLKIGVIQLAEHVALDEAYAGFVEGLKEAGYEDGKNISIDYRNALGEQSNCVPIVDKFVNDGVDLILAIATPAAQTAASKTTEIPILVTAVTDPAAAKLVDSNELPGGNISGTSDLTPVKVQIELLHEILPEAKNVGILFCSSEDNSEIQADMAIEELENLGMTGEKYTFSTLDEIQSVVSSMEGKVDAIYAPTDNKVADGMATVSMIATEAGLPCIVGETGMVNNGGLATYGLDYFVLGKMTGAQAASIFNKEAETATMPIAYISEEDCKFAYNEEVAEQLGITIDISKYE